MFVWKLSRIVHHRLSTIARFTPQVPEYCRSLDETEIRENAFSLIFAFDEIVALGYRENVNLAQIRTFVEMDSHEEKVYQAVRQVPSSSSSSSSFEMLKLIVCFFIVAYVTLDTRARCQD